MTPENALKSLESQGITVEIDGNGKLFARAAIGDVTAAQITVLRENKQGIIAFLRRMREAGAARNGAEYMMPPESDKLRYHTRQEFERLILCRISHGPDTLAAICSGTDETELAAALVLCDMERRGLIRIVYRDTDTPPYYEESIIQAH